MYEGGYAKEFPAEIIAGNRNHQIIPLRALPTLHLVPFRRRLYGPPNRNLHQARSLITVIKAPRFLLS